MFDSVDNDQLGTEITTLAGNLHAGTARFLALIGEFDARGAWGDWGIMSCAHWLEWRCGLASVTSREQVRVARALRQLPAIAERFESGELSYSKVRAITRIATDATEELLLEWALHATAAQLDRIVRGVRFARAVEDPTVRHKHRRVSVSYDEDGFMDIRARLEPEEGAMVVRALELAEAAALSTGDVSAESPDCGDPFGVDAATPAQQARADALIAVAEAYIAGGQGALTGPDRAAVMVHVDAATLAGAPPDRCDVENGPAIHPSTLRRLACDATLVAAVENSRTGEQTIGRRSRVVPRRMRRALRARDRYCRYPACYTMRADAHHIKHWAGGGHTKLSNLLLLCRRHHRLVHEYGFKVERDDPGRVTFRRPDGRAVEAAPTTGSSEDLAMDVHDRGVRIEPNTCRTRWDGHRPDYGIAVEGFLAREEPEDPG